ncbi:MAG: C4-type zinc ribbon domain-containing protein [Bacteroidota bacterium]
MAVKDQTVAEKLNYLKTLQELDSKIDELEVLKGELPMEVQDLEDELEGLGTRVANLEGAIKGYQDEINRHIANTKESETLIMRYQTQLDNVKNNREYEALSKEIELQKLEIQLSEKKIKSTKGLMGEKEEVLKHAQQRIDMRNNALEEKKVELEKITAETEKEEVALRKKIDKARKNIEDRLLRAYDKLRGAYRNGLAVVPVERNACGGCFNQIPPQIQMEINQLKKVIVCEHCGRILVDNKVEEPAK